VARLTVHITDVNDKAPQFQGVDVNGQYPAAVSDYTRRGDEVIFVSAIDLDTTAPNNVVSELYYIFIIHLYRKYYKFKLKKKRFSKK